MLLLLQQPVEPNRDCPATRQPSTTDQSNASRRRPSTSFATPVRQFFPLRLIDSKDDKTQIAGEGYTCEQHYFYQHVLFVYDGKMHMYGIQPIRWEGGICRGGGRFYCRPEARIKFQPSEPTQAHIDSTRGPMIPPGCTSASFPFTFGGGVESTLQKQMQKRRQSLWVTFLLRSVPSKIQQT